MVGVCVFRSGIAKVMNNFRFKLGGKYGDKKMMDTKDKNKTNKKGEQKDV